jgi:hypothetical protein
MKQKDISIDYLWDTTPPAKKAFDPQDYKQLPEPARRYMEHSIAPGTPLAAAVRLEMHGEINLNRWLPFQAEQIIRWDRGMIWKAKVKMAGLPVKGFDRVIEGEGQMNWKLLGLLPVLSEAGPDISRSSVGRMGTEAVWLPSVFCRPDTNWYTPETSFIKASYPLMGETIAPELKIGPQGQLETVKIKRWGSPGEGGFHYEDFGGLAEAEKTFSGYTIPTVLRVGWHFGSERFESEGEFFRVVIDDARFL